MVVAVALMGPSSDEPLIVALLCTAVALLRLTFGYGRYLRFNLPFFTALATQAMVLLTIYVVELNIGWITVGPRQ